MSKLIEVAKTHHLSINHRKLVKVDGYQIALFNVEGTIYAINNLCPHSTGPLIEGRIFNTVITCPWHGAQFDITTGKCCNGPATIDVISYPVRVIDDKILVELS